MALSTSKNYFPNCSTTNTYVSGSGKEKGQSFVSGHSAEAQSEHREICSFHDTVSVKLWDVERNFALPHTCQIWGDNQVLLFVKHCIQASRQD